MDQPPPPGSPVPPPSPTPAPPPGFAGSSGTGGSTPQFSAPPPRSKLPWILGGCGCLTIIGILAIVLIFALARAGGSKKSYDSYRGSPDALLKSEMSTGSIKFKLSAKSDRMDYWRQFGATAATGFTYQQTAAGVTVPIQGALVNFPSSSEAVAALQRVATSENATVEAKKNGKRFTANGGKFVAWTNGSLMCAVNAEFERPAQNFEEAAPF